MKRVTSQSRVELTREESRSRLQDLVRSPELPVFSFEFTNAFSFIGADPGPATGINLRLPDPTPQRLRGHPRLRRDRLNTRPLRAMLALVLEHQGNRTLPELPRIPLRPRHLTDPLKAIGLQQTRGGSRMFLISIEIVASEHPSSSAILAPGLPSPLPTRIDICLDESSSAAAAARSPRMISPSGPIALSRS